MVTAFPILYFLAGLASLFVLIGCLFASNDDKLTWHDQWAKTAVEKRVQVTPGGFPVEPDTSRG
jgi:hypothetical protein